MIGENINIDKLLQDIDQQIEILVAIANDNPILTEQLRLLLESREVILSQELEIGRLEEMVDPDDYDDRLTIIDLRQEAENGTD